VAVDSITAEAVESLHETCHKSEIWTRASPLDLGNFTTALEDKGETYVFS